MKIILDTDIGDDIDDTIALAYLLKQPRCELLGVTTVTECEGKRAKIASMVCRAAGRGDVPIYPGAREPLLVTPRHASAPQFPALAGWDHQTEFPQGQAVEFMRRAIHAHPGDVVIVAIGPLTNLALLFQADPDAAAKLKGLVLMGGSFYLRRGVPDSTEWNIKSDPHAAAIVYRTPLAMHRSVGLDVTLQVSMDQPAAAARFKGGVLDAVGALLAVYFGWSNLVTFHDPLAAATLFDDSLCRFERGRIEVETASDHLKGFTHWQPDENGPHEIAASVDAAKFFEHYFSVFD